MAKQDTASAFLQAIRKGEAGKSSARVKVSLEVDRAVLAYFEGGDFGPDGGSALTQMHQVLRAHVEAAQAAPEIAKRKGWGRR